MVGPPAKRVTSKRQEVTKGQVPSEAEKEQKQEWGGGGAGRGQEQWAESSPPSSLEGAQRPSAAQLPSLPGPGLQHPYHKLWRHPSWSQQLLKVPLHLLRAVLTS